GPGNGMLAREASTDPRRRNWRRRESRLWHDRAHKPLHPARTMAMGVAGGRSARLADVFHSDICSRIRALEGSGQETRRTTLERNLRARPGKENRPCDLFFIDRAHCDLGCGAVAAALG